MKITDLKPNDVIHIKTKKEAKGILKLINFPVKPSNLINKYVFLYETDLGYAWSHDISGKDEIIPASKFIKPSLSNRVKALERKIKVLEKGSDFMQEINNIEVDSYLVANCNDLSVNKELNELPEKWCIRLNEDFICEWVNNNTKCTVDIRTDSNWYFHNIDHCGWQLHESNSDGYILLVTEDFKRLVIKENEPAKEPESIDWSKSNILEHKGHGNPYLVLSNPIAKQNDFTFFGTVIIPSNDYTHSRYGEYIYLEKSSFKLYTGEPITLKNN